MVAPKKKPGTCGWASCGRCGEDLRSPCLSCRGEVSIAMETPDYWRHWNHEPRGAVAVKWGLPARAWERSCVCCGDRDGEMRIPMAFGPRVHYQAQVLACSCWVWALICCDCPCIILSFFSENQCLHVTFYCIAQRLWIFKRLDFLKTLGTLKVGLYCVF